MVGKDGERSQEVSAFLSFVLEEAERGSPNYQFCLGLMFMRGDEVRKDPVQAARWLEAAAVQGHPDAQFALGWLHLQGEGMPVDLAKGGEWIRRAADGGHPLAGEIVAESEGRPDGPAAPGKGGTQ